MHVSNVEVLRIAGISTDLLRVDDYVLDTIALNYAAVIPSWNCWDWLNKMLKIH